MAQNIQSLGASGLYGTYTATGGGGNVARSELDAARMGIARMPHAEYPDGYLGAIPSRRGDRILDSIKTSQTQRSYTRGVHKGERIDAHDYFWPSQLHPQRGLRNEARGKRTGPLMVTAEATHLVNDGKSDMPSSTPGEINPVRAQQMLHLRPAWS